MSLQSHFLQITKHRTVFFIPRPTAIYGLCEVNKSMRIIRVQRKTRWRGPMAAHEAIMKQLRVFGARSFKSSQVR